MDKRERLEKTMVGDLVDRPPVAVWQHWPGDDQRAADLARSHVDFMRYYDWDFLPVVPSRQFMVIDYGLQDTWRGANTGQREITKTPVQRTLHWTDLRPIDPNRGHIGKQLQCLQLIRESLGEHIPIIQFVHSPLTQALLLGGQNLLLRSMRTQPDRLHTGLNTLTETTLRFIEALHRSTNIDGIFYVVDFASYNHLSEVEYKHFGLSYDAKILESLSPNWWLNMVQLNGVAPMLHLFVQMPIQVMNWSTVEARPSLDRVRLDFEGALCGGLGENEHLHLGTPTLIRDAVREAVNIMGQRRLVIGHGDTIPISSPRSNLSAARNAVNLTLS